jgi:hypothetical protein
MHKDDRALRDQLRDQLRAADPARALHPASPTWLAQRMEHIMTDQPSSSPLTTPENSRPPFRRWAPVIGIVAGVAIAAAIVAPLVLGGPEPTVEALQPSTGGSLASSSCLMLEPATIAAQEQAFAATVLQIEDGTVVLEVTERFTGDVADRVEVAQVDALASDNSGVPFKVGQSYLIGAVAGTITGCGVSGTDSAELRTVYDAAFPG